MNKTILIGMTALALTIGGCGRKTPVADASSGAVDPNAGAPVTAADDSVDLVELPAMQADLVAKAGSDTIYFGTDQYGLDQASRATLGAQARWMLANPSVRGSIEGHADERGTREYNLALGERRANSAKDFLIASGVPAGRLTVISWGKERPAAQGSDESAWAQNRRAVTVVVK
ncbi:peptidoglycan-associated lipoprotein Pal [Sphingomonas sp. LY160]|uniref:peptidoglycan-associated lipoprotein Pal n=1 Tax=Sphingomonas sp. LY160 TaxID=3095342 RepID=UPI002ADEE685|nr:peptidoglycan-associated lipoprotein Pal [Sphingomonas sp. LY160]MEA1072742.1 peptidoglycan-associated lipoprotein Pal [Sphingomonas sp. LY160]